MTDTETSEAVFSTKNSIFSQLYHFVLFRPIKKRSFNLLCVLDPLYPLKMKTELLEQHSISFNFKSNTYVLVQLVSSESAVSWTCVTSF